MAKKYVDVDEFAEAICNFPAIDEHSANAVISLLHRQPTADVVEVKHGEWIKDNKIKSPIFFNCSLCGNTADKDIHGNYIGITPYCSMCGAKMDGNNLSTIPTGSEGSSDNEQSI